MRGRVAVDEDNRWSTDLAIYVRSTDYVECSRVCKQAEPVSSSKYLT